MLAKITHLPFILTNLFCLYFAFTNSSLANDNKINSSIFKKCISKKSRFTCNDRYAFLQDMGIDIEEDLIDFKNLKLIEAKTVGAAKGGIYADKQDPSQIYFVKKVNAYHEFIAAKIMNYIAGTQATPTVKLIKNKSKTVASLKLPNFDRYYKADLTNKKIIGEALLIVAMDFIGLVDRHSNNMGYVALDDNTLLAARVDFDACFDYESTVTGSHQPTSARNHRDLKHLYVTMQTYPKHEVEKAIKKVVSMPDEEIVMITFQAWAALSKTKSPKSLEKCLKLSRKLIERKKAFKKALKQSHKKQSRKVLSMFH